VLRRPIKPAGLIRMWQRERWWDRITRPSPLCVKMPIRMSQKPVLNIRKDLDNPHASNAHGLASGVQPIAH
jgi:hypothetical protein